MALDTAEQVVQGSCTVAMVTGLPLALSLCQHREAMGVMVQLLSLLWGCEPVHDLQGEILEARGDPGGSGPNQNTKHH